MSISKPEQGPVVNEALALCRADADARAGERPTGCLRAAPSHSAAALVNALHARGMRIAREAAEDGPSVSGEFRDQLDDLMETERPVFDRLAKSDEESAS